MGLKNYSIKEVKNKIKAAVATDNYMRTPGYKRKPIIIQGGAGVGKTYAIQQIAEELEIGFIAKNLNCYTRPEMKGLPFIKDSENGKVTEYTMPDILRTIYEYIDTTGKQEGIVFLDEINTVADSVKPQMLELLQFKRIGDMPMPEGWHIVGACNPVGDINDSATSFDDATRTRVVVYDVEADFESWKEYAIKANVNQLVMMFLNLYPNNFTTALERVSDTFSVNPRVWEGLSDEINKYESIIESEDAPAFLKKAAKEDLDDLTKGGGCSGYLANIGVAQDFMAFAKIYDQYSDIEDIIDGKETTYDIDQLDKAMAITGQVVRRFKSIAKEKVSYIDKLRKIVAPLNKIINQESTVSKEVQDSKKIIKELQVEYTSLNTSKKYEDRTRAIEVQRKGKMETEKLAALEGLAKLLKNKDSGEIIDVTRKYGLKFVAEANEIKKDLDKVINNIFNFIEKVFANHTECEMPFFDMIINDEYILRYSYDSNNEAFKKALNRNDTIKKGADLIKRLKTLDVALI